MHKYEEYRNKKGYGDGENEGDRCVAGSWLWEQLAVLRGAPVNSNIRTNWKIAVGCCVSAGVYPNLEIKVDKRWYLTPREAAGILMLALWTEQVRAIVAPQKRISQIRPEQIPSLFNQWMESGVAEDIKPILKDIYQCPAINYEDLSAVFSPKVEDVAQKNPNYESLGSILEAMPGKIQIPPSTIRRWVRELGGNYKAGRRCPSDILSAIFRRAQTWQPKRKTKE